MHPSPKVEWVACASSSGCLLELLGGGRSYDIGPPFSAKNVGVFTSCPRSWYGSVRSRSCEGVHVDVRGGDGRMRSGQG